MCCEGWAALSVPSSFCTWRGGPCLEAGNRLVSRATSCQRLGFCALQVRLAPGDSPSILLPSPDPGFCLPLPLSKVEAPTMAVGEGVGKDGGNGFRLILPGKPWEER